MDQKLFITIDRTTTPVTPKLTHETGPFPLVASSFLARIPRLAGRGILLPPPVPLQNRIEELATEIGLKRPICTELTRTKLRHNMALIFVLVSNEM